MPHPRPRIPAGPVRGKLPGGRRVSSTVLATLAVTVLCVGCATHADRVRCARELFYAGDVAAAAREFEQRLSRLRSDGDVIALDLAVARLFSGQPRQAEQTLRQVRDRFDEREQPDAAEAALTMLTDDNRRAYAGEDYEKVMIRVLLALSNLMVDGTDAEAYCLQITAKQQQIIEAARTPDGQNPKSAYSQVALGAYLHGILREETHANYDDVERSFANVVSWQPSFAAGVYDLHRAQRGVHSAPGNGVLHVLAFVGRGPYKREVSEIPTSEALLIADRILSATADHPLPPTIAPIQVPQVLVAPNDVDRVLVAAGGQIVGPTETITDVGRLAVQQYQAIYPQIIARAVARRAIKKAAVYSAESHLDSGSPWVNLAILAAGVAWEATESADTRCWALLPNTIQVLRVELPAGQHIVSLRAARGPTPLGPESEVTVPVENGRNSYLLAFFPGHQLAGQVLVSRRL